MIKTGLTRRLDDLNRLTIPKEMVKNLGFKANQEMEFGLNEDNEIVLSPVSLRKRKSMVREVLSAGREKLTAEEYVTLSRILDKLDL